MIRNPVSAIGLCFLSALWSATGSAHDLTRSECAEGGEFIRNAALARDYGVTRDFFVKRLSEDLALIQSFPPHLRWFVQDDLDEQLLSEAVYKVFDEPVSAEEHESAFIGTCMQSKTALLDNSI